MAPAACSSEDGIEDAGRRRERIRGTRHARAGGGDRIKIVEVEARTRSQRRGDELLGGDRIAGGRSRHLLDQGRQRRDHGGTRGRLHGAGQSEVGGRVGAALQDQRRAVRCDAVVAGGVGGGRGFAGIGDAVEVGVGEDGGAGDVPVDAEAMQDVGEETADLVGHVPDGIARAVEAGADEQQPGNDVLAGDAIGGSLMSCSAPLMVSAYWTMRLPMAARYGLWRMVFESRRRSQRPHVVAPNATGVAGEEMDDQVGEPLADRAVEARIDTVCGM